ncbi:MAG: hypothetical protein ABEK50_13530 [bacterium]
MGIWGGLVRLGLFTLPVTTEIFVHHGAIMVGGFLGTLIGFERAVAVDPDWPFLTPFFCITGTVLLLVGVNPVWGKGCVLAGSVVMTLVFAYLLYQQWTDHGVLLMIASACWVTGNGFWLYGWSVLRLVYWWMSFLVLIIVTERLELNRPMTIEGFKKIWFFGSFGGVIAGLVLRGWYPVYGSIVIWSYPGTVIRVVDCVRRGPAHDVGGWGAGI